MPERDGTASDDSGAGAGRRAPPSSRRRAPVPGRASPRSRGRGSRSGRL